MRPKTNILMSSLGFLFNLLYPELGAKKPATWKHQCVQEKKQKPRNTQQTILSSKRTRKKTAGQHRNLLGNNCPILAIHHKKKAATPVDLCQQRLSNKPRCPCSLSCNEKFYFPAGMVSKAKWSYKVSMRQSAQPELPSRPGINININTIDSSYWCSIRRSLLKIRSTVS